MISTSQIPTLRRVAVFVLSRKKFPPPGNRGLSNSSSSPSANVQPFQPPPSSLFRARISVVLAPYSTRRADDGSSSSAGGDTADATDKKTVYSLREMQKKTLPGDSPQADKKHYDRNFITTIRAMHDFLLKQEHLAGLRMTSRRSPHTDERPLNVYWRKDIEAKSLEVWGSMEALEAERERRKVMAQEDGASSDSMLARYLRTRREKVARTRPSREKWPVRRMAAKETTEEGLESQTGRVVLSAVAINTMNTLGKLVAWLATGSHAMFSETIHSAADTANQLILVYGIRKSVKSADSKHPYGYSNMPYVSALISGVGIFCMGAGLSVYHGITGLVEPHPIESLPLAFGILAASFVSESVTLVMAIKSIRESAAKLEMGFFEFVAGGYDPCVNVVLLEDVAAVAGVVIAGGAMGATSLLNSHIPDAVGSLAIGGLLGIVASFMIYTNTTALVGRSIPEEKLLLINRELEGDIMVRQIHDVKGIDMGNGVIRYKAEVDVDGRELALYYLRKKNLRSMLDEVNAMKTEQELETFLLQHGENIVDCLGEQVDRIEVNLKKTHPEVKHVDLEVL